MLNINSVEIDSGENAPLSVYVHWPYCARICPYCDFNVYKNKPDSDLTASIIADLKAWRELTGPRKIQSLHFGGGTPSLMRAHDIAHIIETVGHVWHYCDTPEIALEANPADAHKARWTEFKQAGINRLSLGVQSFNDTALKLLGRDHNADEARKALALCAETFEAFSLDLIYGWSGQDTALLHSDIETALRYNPPHISAYQLTIEDNTAFGRALGRGDNRAVNADESANFFETVAAQLTQAGYNHYEISNFAKSGFESRHNLGYWEGQDYVGVGPGAHGRYTQNYIRHATICESNPALYSQRVKEQGIGLKDIQALSRTERSDEYLIMGLRISKGISLARYEQLGGTLNQAAMAYLIQDGFLQIRDNHLQASAKGRLVLNHLTQQLLT